MALAGPVRVTVGRTAKLPPGGVKTGAARMDSNVAVTVESAPKDAILHGELEQPEALPVPDRADSTEPLAGVAAQEIVAPEE